MEGWDELADIRQKLQLKWMNLMKQVDDLKQRKKPYL